MKLSVIYHSVSGNTARMAQVIAEGMKSVPGIEARAFSIDAVDADFARESQCVVVGCPTYVADTSAGLHLWMEKEMGRLGLPGKLGGAFATAQYIHGDADLLRRREQGQAGDPPGPCSHCRGRRYRGSHGL